MVGNCARQVRATRADGGRPFLIRKRQFGRGIRKTIPSGVRRRSGGSRRKTRLYGSSLMIVVISYRANRKFHEPLKIVRILFNTLSQVHIITHICI